jgi:hypothetical protein
MTSYGTITTPVSGTITASSAMPPTFIHLFADLDASVQVRIQLAHGYGVFTSMAIAPGTYNLSGAELDYATCGACVFLHVDSVTTPYDIYMATGGTLDVTSISGTFSGTISNATFTHSKVNGGSLHSAPFGDGCSSAITSVPFSQAIP